MPNIGILYTHEISHFYRQMLKKKKKTRDWDLHMVSKLLGHFQQTRKTEELWQEIALPIFPFE
jgi:hypothetical protein